MRLFIAKCKAQILEILFQYVMIFFLHISDSLIFRYFQSHCASSMNTFMFMGFNETIFCILFLMWNWLDVWQMYEQ